MVVVAAHEYELCVDQSVVAVEAEHYIIPGETQQRHISQVDNVVGIAVNLITVIVEIINRSVKERSEGDAQDAVDDGCSSVGIPSGRNHRADPGVVNGAVGTCGRGQGTTPTPRVIRVVLVEVVVVVVAVVVKVVVVVVTVMTVSTVSTISSMSIRLAVAVSVRLTVRLAVSTVSTRPVVAMAVVAVGLVDATVGLILATVATVWLAARTGAIIVEAAGARTCHAAVIGLGHLVHISAHATVAATDGGA